MVSCDAGVVNGIEGKNLRAVPATEVAPAPGGVGTAARQRKLAALLCADVAGYSRLMGADEGATYESLSRLRAAIDPLIAAQGGRIVSTAGDGLLVDFASIVDALTCAVEIQENALRLNDPLPPDRRLELRIGVNLGDVIVAEDGDLYGDGVNIAARLQTLAAPGEICLSQTVYDQVRNKLDLGYRPLGAHRVKNISDPVRAYAIGDPSTSPTRRRPWLRRLPIAAGIAGVAFIAAIAAWTLGYLPASRISGFGASSQAAMVANLATPARLAERTTVAVLPFRNLSPEPGQDFFSDGITEDIINALGRFSDLLVAAKSASFQFKGKNVSPEEAGRRLDVRYLVEGSVRRAGDRLRITVELTEAGTGFHLWSNDYNIETKDVFAVQDEITKRIVGAAAVKLTQIERARVLRKPTANLAAYEFVLRGRSNGLVNQTRAANDAAGALYKRAIDLDPNYAEAYAAFGWVHYEAAVSGWTEFPEDEVRQAEMLAKKALALDPATTDAFQLLSAIGVFRGDYDGALAQIDRALALNPSASENFQERGYILLWSGKPAEAVPWLAATLRLDGSSSRAAFVLGAAKYFLSDYGEATTALDRALASSPGRAIQLNAHAVLAATYAKLNKPQDAERQRDMIMHLAPFFDAGRFAEQFGTQKARDDMLAGLKAAGFQ
jgi:adenylate cyclase